MSRPLSIGIVCFPTLGGSGVVASELAAGLAQRGHAIHLIASAHPIREFAPSSKETFHEVQVPTYPLLEHAPYALAVASKIVDVAQAHGLDLLQVHYAVPHAASALLARQVLGRAAPALVTSLHGTDVTKVGAHPAYRAVTAFAVAGSDGITVPSDFLRREARAQLGIADTHAIDVLPNFVDTDHFVPAAIRDRSQLASLFAPGAHASNGPYLIHVSNFREVKRVGDLMEVLVRVRRHLPARLVLVGDGPTRELAVSRANALGVTDAVRFLGRRAEFVQLLQHADGFLLPSESESFGVAALEALSTGVPVFAYHVGGLPDVVVDGVGCLVTPFDLDALAQAVIDVLINPERHAAMGRAARAHAVATFGEQPALDRYEHYFRQVIARRQTETTS